MQIEVHLPDDPRPLEEFPLILLFHGYSTDSTWATERYFLQNLVANDRYIVISLNGRQVGFSYNAALRKNPWARLVAGRRPVQ